ncbi:MAG: endonuclease III, partial [Clostridia bacterium]|nr:endonuclease III [Clostridia bacterium]
MNNKERALKCVEALKKEYPEAECALVAGDPFQLLVATRLSAQCTDARVNMITPALFKKYPTTEAFAKAKLADVEELVHSCGFYHAKAKDIIGAAQAVLERFDGVVPDNIEDLTSLPGVGRKTANLIVGDIYGKPA